MRIMLTNTPFETNHSHVILLIALGLAALACYLLIAPYLQPILIAFIFALIFYPVHKWIVLHVRGRENLAALLSCLLLTFIIELPLFFTLLAILRQGVIYSRRVYDWLSGGGLDALMAHPWIVGLLSQLKEWMPHSPFSSREITQRLMEAASSLGGNVVNLSAKLASDVTGFFVSFLLMLFVFFFVLRDYDRIFSFVRHAIPLSRSQEDILLAKIHDVTKSALLGSLLTAVSQGIAGGVALSLAGFPGLFWGTIMAFTSLIPFIGTAMIWLPAAIYLLVTGDWGWGVFLILWGFLVVGAIDNFLRPLFMQGSSAMSTVLIFFALLGGIHVFGLIGLLYGPIIFAVTLALFRMYEQEFQTFLDYQDRH